MDREIKASVLGRNESFGQISSANSSMRRLSSGLSVLGPPYLDDDTESESVSEAGNIGDRALPSNRYSGNGRIPFSVDNVSDNSYVVPIQEDTHDLTVSNTISSVSPLPLQILSPLPTDAMAHPGERKGETKLEMPWLLEYISCLIHLAICGILGVIY